MGNHPEYAGTIWEAQEWIEYVNGDQSTPFGRLRALNGHAAPYRVDYWCIGNENYGPWGRHSAETDSVYAERLHQWASVIKRKHPALRLLGVGKSLNWNAAVLAKSGHLVDFLTQHYYVTTRLENGKVINGQNTLFAPAKMELHLEALGQQLRAVNSELGREDNPVRLSIDEWNNRHSVEKADGKFEFTRHSPRTQFDVAVVAGMLNVFIRQSPTVGMANYIFPVNGHGLIRTVGNTDAYITSIYHVFKQYREWMVGHKLVAEVAGPALKGAAVKPNIEGDGGELLLTEEDLPYLDATAVLNDDGSISLSLVNRSFDAAHQVTLEVPAGYAGDTLWALGNPDIHTANSAAHRNAVAPDMKTVKARRGKINLDVPACGVYMVRLVPLQ